jgi:hypothetical protein
MKFNKELLANLLKKAKGDRSIIRFGFETDVDPGYISRLLRSQVETPPGAMVLKKIAGHAANDVTIEQLLGAAGYINFPQIDVVVGDDNGRAPQKTPTASPPATGNTTGDDNGRAARRQAPASPPATGNATGSYDDRAPAWSDSTLNDEDSDDNSTVEELLSFCKEMIERPILLDAFKQIKDLDDDKLRRVFKMIKMIAEMGD